MFQKHSNNLNKEHDLRQECLLYTNSSFTRPAISYIIEIYRAILSITQMYDSFTLQNGVCLAIMLGFTLGAFYAHITTQVEPTYVCNPENLRNQIGWAFSTLKTHYYRDRIRVTVSTLLL